LQIERSAGVPRRLMLRLAVAAAAFAVLARVCGFADAADAPGLPATPVSLMDHTGRPVTSSDFLGKPSLVVFGFTSCPSICPTMLSDVANRMADIGVLADRINVVFVSVDPERDTPQILGDYLAAFDKRIVGLTGDLASIGAVANAVGAKFQKVPVEGGGYTVDHSGMAFLMDRDGRRTGLLALGPGTDEARANAKLRALAGDAGH
jgi:protein SCO1